MNLTRSFFFAFLFLLTLAAAPVFAQVDWTNGVVRANGTGLPSPNMPEVQGKLLAKRAAISDAYRNMAEMVNAIQVTSETMVKNFVMQSDEIHIKVQAFIQGALVVDEKQNDDGSYEVTIEAPIYGVGSLADFLLSDVAKKTDKYNYVTGDETGSEEFTGLLIDARGVEVKPSLAPAVFNTNAEIVYDASMLDSSAYSQGVAAFVEGGDELLNAIPLRPYMFAANPFMSFDFAGFFMLHMAVKNPKLKSKVGNKPLVVKALDPKTISGPVVPLAPYNVVVSSDDGKKIAGSLTANNFLKTGNVAVITGGVMPVKIPEPAGNAIACPKGMLPHTDPADAQKEISWCVSY